MDGFQRVLVGVVGAPHGVQGECRVKTYTEEPAAIGRYRPLTTADGRTRFAITKLRPLKGDMVVARFEGVATREAAAALTNTKLFVDRALLPQVEDEEFYHADLIGLWAETDAGVRLGQVVAVPNYGAGDLLEIRTEGAETLLVAFTRAFVPTVDVAGGRLVVSAEALLGAEDEAEGGDDAGGPAEPIPEDGP